MTKGFWVAKGTGRNYKWLVVVACVVAVMLVAILPISVLAVPNTPEQYIGEARAKSIAFEDAGISEGQVTLLKVHLDYDKRHVDYDVSFYVENTKYEYEIDAVSGSILEYDRETKHYAPRNNPDTSGQSPQQAAPDTAGYLSESEVKSLALNHAGLTESQVTQMKVELDHDDGRVSYEVDFHNGWMEYEYEIDAVSGVILESNSEYDD